MNEHPYSFGRNGAVSTVETRNRVLRNTYWLLALSMIPTVLGAWVGLTTGFSLFAATSPAMSMEVWRRSMSARRMAHMAARRPRVVRSPSMSATRRTHRKVRSAPSIC